MVASAPTLDLYTPGLFGAWSPSQAEGLTLPALPAMQRAWARSDAMPLSDTSPSLDLEPMLLTAFGLPAETGVAPFTRLADGGRRDSSWWMRADPVHLQADQDRVLLFAGEAVQVEADEAEALRALLDPHVQELGWGLQTPTPQRWYLRLPDDPQLHAVALHEVVGRDIQQRLPGGAQGKRWRAVLTELQMLLHAAVPNQQREARGQLPINSLWLWGAGRLPEPDSNAAPWDTVASDEPLARGLAQWSGLRVLPGPENFDAWQAAVSDGTHLVVLDQLRRHQHAGHWQSWRDAVLALERDWLAPALRGIRSGALRTLRWWPGGDRVLHIDRHGLRRFWRRSRPLPWIAEGSHS